LTVFQLSRQFPLVSAFYHIAKTLAILCEKGNVFKNLDKSSTTDVKRLLEEYQAFIHEVSSGLRFYKDELLVACSGFLLSTPVIVIKDIQIMLPALQAAISIGKSHTEIAEIAVSTLERWIKFIPDQLEASIELIIKSIASYLAQSNAPDIVGTSMPLSSLGGNQAPKQGTVSDQMKLQIRILKFLGEANGSTTALLSQQILSSGRMRGFETDLLFLELTLGPSGTYTKFPLDTIFHQIGQVALDSTDRRIKTSASEVYHALICYLCGKTATEPHQSGHKSLFYPLWEKSLENTLLLAVDHEKICRTIFQPLSLQITRWFCSEKIVLPHECSLLLEVLIENVTQATHSGLRDFAAKCLSEYLNVCVSKYHKNDTQAENQADELFERLFDLCHHPSAAQRVGVATTFLFFMREMDDNYGELIARKFGLLSLKKFLIALRLGSHNLTKNGTLDTSLSMMVRAIRTILKLAIRLPHIFGDSSSKDSANNLEMFLLWESI
jgi:DNA-dependent protein kinase catalytic subunit